MASLDMARKKAIGETKSMMTDNNNNINADSMRESKRKIDKAHSADNSHTATYNKHRRRRNRKSHNCMKTKKMDITNSYFNVRMNECMDVIVVTLAAAVIPAEQWNRLRESICKNTKIGDDVTVYFDYLIINGETDRFCSVTVENWRRLGFSGNNVKNCIPSAPKEVIDESDRFFYYFGGDILDNSVLCGKRLETYKQKILKSIYIAEFKTLTKDVWSQFTALGMTHEEIDKWFKQVIHEVNHPKCKSVQEKIE